jgi:LmbE family N-acetylglucosaminyl deacetylase
VRFLERFSSDRVESASGRWPGANLILSPHADDAAFSIGGLLHLGALGGPVTLLTIFGASNYLEHGGFQSDWESVMRVRQAEEEAFAARLKLNLDFRALPEAAMREAGEGDKLFASSLGEQLADFPALPETLAGPMRDAKVRTVWIPLALGGHRDHLLVHRAATRIAETLPAVRCYYEDLPYADQLPERSIRRHAAAVDRRLRPVFVPIESVIERKMEALNLYPSQVSARHRDAVEAYARRWSRTEARERIWTAG